MKIEIVFISDDGNKEAFIKNFSEMQWYALPFEDSKGKMMLKEMLGVNAIPNATLL